MIEVIDPATGKKYPSLSAAAKTIGISHGALHLSPQERSGVGFFHGPVVVGFLKRPYGEGISKHRRNGQGLGHET